jgi:hypothetical protein
MRKPTLRVKYIPEDPTDDLTALSAEVAVLMGWEHFNGIRTADEGVVDEWTRGDELHDDAPPPYATADPSTPEGAMLMCEKIAWLAAHGGWLTLTIDHTPEGLVANTDHPLGYMPPELSEPLPEALARAVVATGVSDGAYFCICSTCGGRFSDDNKRAVVCPACRVGDTPNEPTSEGWYHWSSPDYMGGREQCVRVFYDGIFKLWCVVRGGVTYALRSEDIQGKPFISMSSGTWGSRIPSDAELEGLTLAKEAMDAYLQYSADLAAVVVTHTANHPDPDDDTPMPDTVSGDTYRAAIRRYSDWRTQQ